jgi:hypothetical protein
MLHEIVDPEDGEYLNLNEAFKDGEEELKGDDNIPPLVGPHQRLEVVKITRCKMRAKDILELEIGLKNLTVRNLAFEQRKFILRFLDKSDPLLACKGRIVIDGKDLMSI